MTGDHQPDEGKPADSKEPSGAPATPSTDAEPKVPLSELVKKRQEAAQAKKAEEEARQSAEAKDAKIKELEDRLAKSENDDTADGDEGGAGASGKTTNDDDPERLSRLDEVLRKEDIRDLRDQHDLTFDQAEKVYELMQEMPGLKFDEAYAIAASRNVDVFSEDGGSGSGFDPSTHGSTRPRPQGQPAQQQDDYQDRLKFIRDNRKGNKRLTDQVWNNMVGSIASKQVGRSGHTLMPIPRVRNQ